MRQTKSFLNMKTLGNPVLVLKDKNKYVMGLMFGFANKIIMRSDNQGSPQEALQGIFATEPKNEVCKDAFESTILFLPDVWHNKISAILRKAQEADKRVGVEFAIAVSVKKTRDHGFDWEGEILFSDIRHPLAAIEKRLK